MKLRCQLMFFFQPFGLNSLFPPINNASSNFYYKYTEDFQVRVRARFNLCIRSLTVPFQAQVVDYVQQCSPFTSVSSFFASRYFLVSA